MTNLQHALEYAKRGLPVFPCFYVKKSGKCSCGKTCKRTGKHPMSKNGLKDATRDPEQINSWWKATPRANIATATGHDSLFVVDIDVSGGKPGQDSLDKLTKEFGELPETRRQETGSGGAHYFFYASADIKNSAGKVGKAIDIRGKGGYVILPPSNHASGHKYKWTKDIKIAEAPQWLIDLSIIDPRQDAPPDYKPEDLARGKFTAEETRLILKHIDSDDRDVWFKVGAALLTEFGGPKGFELWDEWASQSAKYNAENQARTWRSMRPGQISMGTIVVYAKDGGWKGFDSEAADQPEMKQEWIWVVAIKRFIHIPTFQELDAEQFSGKFAPLFKKGKAADHFLRNPEFPRVDGKTYWPLKDRIVTEDGLRKLNVWRPGSAKPVAGNFQPFLDHVEYIIPIEEEQKILLDYLAFQVQHPGSKVHWALLIQGPPGNGKSFFGKIMRNVLGPHNVTFLNSETLHESYTGWQKDTQFVVVEEVMARGRMEMMNKLKPIITEPWAMIREMYKPPYEQPNRLNFLMMTNHRDALILDEGDRRYCVLSASSQPKSTGYYKRLFSWAKDNTPALLHWFQQRDLSGFLPNAYAPFTVGKQDMIEESLPALDHWISQQVENKMWPFAVDLVLPSDIATVTSQFALQGNPKKVGKAFRRLGYASLGKRYLGKQRGSLWAVRNEEDYKGLSPQKLQSLWTFQAGDSSNGESENAPALTRHLNVAKETKPM